jgi:hypothetical protein
MALNIEELCGSFRCLDDNWISDGDIGRHSNCALALRASKLRICGYFHATAVTLLFSLLIAVFRR